jgi:hypothetical protein
VDLGASYLHGYDFEDDLQRDGHKMNPLQALVFAEKRPLALLSNAQKCWNCPPCCFAISDNRILIERSNLFNLQAQKHGMRVKVDRSIPQQYLLRRENV